MCKHQYTFPDYVKNTNCEWSTFYKNILEQTSQRIEYADLPIDSDGFCIFHSKDIAWKRENNFFERFVELVSILDERIPKGKEDNVEIRFIDFQIVGIKTNEVQKEFHNRSDEFSKEDLNAFTFSKLIVKNDFMLFSCVFSDAVNLNNVVFKKDIILDDCIFKQNVYLNKIFIKNDLFIDNCSFSKQFAWTRKSIITGTTEITNSIFSNRTDFEAIYFEAYCRVENCNFEGELPVEFTCSFKNGIDFSGNTFNAINFDACCFYENSTFKNLQENGPINFYRIEIDGKINFVGSSEKLMFQHHSVFNLIDENMADSSIVVFDYCNILNLDEEFLRNIKDLETAQRVKVNYTCQIERLTKVFEYPDTHVITEHIAHDYAQIVKRFFNYRNSTHLKANVEKNRIDNSIRIIFSTTDDISEERFYSIIHGFIREIKTTNSSDVIINDIKHSLKHLLERINALDLKELEINIFEDIISLNNLIDINNIPIIMAKKITINQPKAKIEKQYIDSTVYSNDFTVNFTSSELEQLNSEIIQLKEALIRQTEHEEQKVDIEYIEKAQIALDNNDKKSFLKSLKNVSSWVFNVARDIGVNVISSYITSQTS